MRPSPIGTAAPRKNLLLAADLLSPSSPYSPITPSSTVAFGFNSFKRVNSETKDGGGRSTTEEEFKLSAPPTPTSASAEFGLVVKLSDGTFAVKTLRKTLRIVEEVKQDTDAKEKGKASVELAEGDEVTYKADGQKAFSVRKRQA